MNTALILRTWFAEGEFLDRSATAEDVARLKPSWVSLTRQEPWTESASDYERGVIDGRQMQAQSSVDKAVNAMSQRKWVGLTDEDMDCLFPHGATVWVQETVKIIETKLKEAYVTAYITAAEPLDREVMEASVELRRLHKCLRNVYEVWAGSEGIPAPTTASEAYLLSLVEQMRDAAKEGLK